VLTLAARYEQARGNNERAADYYRASIAAMPSVSPTDRLAHQLVFPEQYLNAHRAVTAADLQRLLDPNNEPFAKTTKLPPLPAYGPDPYQGGVPVTLPQAAPAPQFPPVSNPSTGSHDLPPPMPIPHAMLQGNPSPRPSASGARLVLASWTFSRPRFITRSDFVRATPIRPVILQAAAQPGSNVEVTLNPPHSLASDAWKGLVFSLMASNRNAEALAQLSKIPPEVRSQLEADIEWTQGLASLYFSVGDTPEATYYLKRVQDFYLLHPGVVPADLALQHAWLLYNIKNDVALYPVLMQLDARQDLTTEQRRQVQSIWANWAIRRAADDIDNGQAPQAIQILQAAMQDYPDNLSVRFAAAGAYLRIGRALDALAIYKASPMANAGSGDYQGAVGAALAARDMAQAEIWLRVALNRFPNDSKVLGLAAQFEQARGNNRRATEFWHAALAAAPQGSSAANLATGTSSGLISNPTPTPGETKRLLDPRFSAAPSPEELAPLPSFKPQPSMQSLLTPPVLPPAQQSQPISAASNLPLPLPSSSAYQPEEQGIGTSTTSSNGPALSPTPSAPVFVAPANPQQALSQAGSGNPSAVLPPPSQLPSRTSSSSPEQSANNSQPVLQSGSNIHNIPAAPVPQPLTSQPASAPDQSSYNMAQYSPSAQDAATGAFSAPQQQRPSTRPPAAAPEKPHAAATAPARKRESAKSRSQSSQPSAQQPTQPPAQTLGKAPIGAAPQQAAVQQPIESASQNPAETTTGAGLSDQELEQQNLPPLRGPWIRMKRQANPPSPREEAEQQLAAIESGYSGWLGGSSLVNYRSGAPGYDQLAAIESPFEASAPLGYHARITAIAKPVFLDSGQANGTANIAVTESESGATCLVTIPEPIGTYTASQNFSPCTSPSIGALKPPAQQNAFGLGGELQLTFPHLAIAGGYTPFNFLVSTFTARFQWRPVNGPVILSFQREPETDSQLSYAGLRDPAGNTLSTLGQIWGGVIANQGLIQVSHGDAQSGFYFAAGGQYLTGYNVKKNNRIDGTGGAYWRVYTAPEFGDLTVGANFFAMHYSNNQNAFTHGMGGYFSPQVYFLGNIPVSWVGHYQTHWHYNITGALGAQAFQEDATPLWPLAGDKPLETSQNNPMLPAVTSVSANYDFHSQVAYQISPHWFAGAYLAANNTRNYTFTSAGFFIRFLFRSQPSAVTGPTGLFPAKGFRPFSVP
jgi:cellulose synthase operon protein C